MSYDMNNIFAKIIRGELPCTKVYEDEHVLAFRDIRPQARVHVLVIPKAAFVSSQDFSEKASEAEIVAFTRAIAKVATETGVAVTGYRVIANTGPDGRPEVPHFHVHILGGQNMGRMVCLD